MNLRWPAVTRIGGALLVLAAAFPSRAPAQEDVCSPPIVRIRTLVNGVDRYRSLILGGQPPAGAGAVSDRALDRIIQANRREVRFVEGIASAPDADFVLSLEETVSEGGTEFEAVLRLQDLKGREVLSSGPVAYTLDEAMGEGLEAVAGRLAGPAMRLLPAIRAHQRRIREQEKSAIHAAIRAEPSRAVVAPGEKLIVTFTLFDCDQGNPPLPNRPVTVDHRGVGRVDRNRVLTDDQGRAKVGFVSGRPGEAELIPAWIYENTSGLRTGTDGGIARVTVRHPFGLRRVRLIPMAPPSVGEGYVLGGLWILADEEVDRTFPDRPAPEVGPGRNPACPGSLPRGSGGIGVPKGGDREWKREGRSGRQATSARVAAGFQGPESARLELSLTARGAPEADWDEEAGSEVSASVSLEWVVDIENPDELDYELAVTPRLEADSSGSGGYNLVIAADAQGCRGPYGPFWGVEFQGDGGEDLPLSVGGGKLVVTGDPHVQAVFRVEAGAGAGGNRMAEPFSGDAKLTLGLDLSLTPLPRR